MTETHDPIQSEQGEEPVSVKEILIENWVLRNALIFFFLMLAIPTFLAWKLDWFLICN
jgi:hypothetical protein